MSRQDILNEINKTLEYLAGLKKRLKEYEYERWKPSDCEEYWFLSTTLLPVVTVNKKGLDRDRCNTYNCFKTKEEAEAEAEKISVRRKLEDIARRLNKGEKIDWNDKDQVKYSLILTSPKEKQKLLQDYNTSLKGEQTYCLDKNFLDVAIQEIGEERLKKYLRGE